MVWYLTPDQVLVHHRDSKTTGKKGDDNNSNSREDPNYDFSIDKIQIIDNSSSKHTQTLCSICNRSDKIVKDPESGEIICSNCGMVLVDKVEDTSHSERRIFSAEGQIDDTRARTGAPTSLARHDMGLATIIGRADKDSSGQKVDPSIRSTMQRLRVWDFRVQLNTPSDRNLKTAFELLYTLKYKLGLSDSIIEKAAYIYRKVQERGLVRGRTVSAVLAAAVYIAYREVGISKTMKDIAAASNLKRKDIARTYRQLVLELDYKVPNMDPTKCIAKVANKTNLSEKTKRQALYIMEEVTENEISAGKDPMGLAATVLYISCIKTREKISQKDISNAAGVTDVTLRNRFRDLKNQLTELN